MYDRWWGKHTHCHLRKYFFFSFFLNESGTLQINLSVLCSSPTCLIGFDTRIILRPYYTWASHQFGRHMQFTAESGSRLTCFFRPLSPCVDFTGPDGTWEDGAGHRRVVRVQEGVAPPGGGALVAEIPLDRGAGEVDPWAAARRREPGGEQEPHHVGHPTFIPQPGRQWETWK